MDAPAAAVSSAALPTLRLSRLLLQHRRPPPGGTRGSAARLRWTPENHPPPTQHICEITLDRTLPPSLPETDAFPAQGDSATCWCFKGR